MGCSHCLNLSERTGAKMTEKTLDLVIKFILKMKPNFINISGGEFTEHEKFYEFILKIIKALEEKQQETVIALLSNGMFYFDDEKRDKIIKLLKNKRIALLQVSTDKRYYPKYNLIKKNKRRIEALHPKVQVVEQIGELYPLGRALVNHRSVALKCTKKPSCSNLYLIPKQFFLRGKKIGLDALVLLLQERTQYNLCKPLIDMHGNVRVGETINCEIIGTVEDDLSVLYNRLIAGNPCNKCGLVKNLPIVAKNLMEV
jgi:hypothetical protein